MTAQLKCTVRLEHIDVSRLKLDSIQLWDTSLTTKLNIQSTATLPLVDESTLEVKTNIASVVNAAFNNQKTMLVAMMPTATTNSPFSGSIYAPQNDNATITINDPTRWVGGTISVENDSSIEIYKLNTASAAQHVDINRPFEG